MRLAIPLSRDPASSLAAISGALRIWEEYRIEGFIILKTRHTPESLVNKLKKDLETLKLPMEEKLMPSIVDYGDGQTLIRDVERLISSLDDRVGILVSSAGRSAAAALTAASIRHSSEDGNTAFHVNFFFGPWRGLHYPYTPRGTQRVIVLHDPGWLRDERRERPENAASLQRFKLHYSKQNECLREDRTETGLPLLRCTVAEMTRRLNEAAAWGGEPGSHIPVSVVARKGSIKRRHKLIPVNPIEILGLSDSLHSFLFEVAERLEHTEPGGTAFKSSLAWTGLSRLHTRQDNRETDLHSFLSSTYKRIIVDTNLVFYGIHFYAWETGRIELPQCVEREITSKWAEIIKRGKLSSPDRLVRALAVLGLEDLLYSSQSVAPSPPGGCDTAIPMMDLQLLNGNYIATSDDGAYRYWKRHPASRVAKPVKVSFDPRKPPSKMYDKGEPVELARLYYASVQTLLVLDLMRENGLIDDLEIKAGDVVVRPPTKALETGLGLS
ncbi:MAG: hypothetical protein F7C32_02340 [Desulfurococcales archaeon]|nr:hypothetical protein [Desulfurococcales archaeon]